MISLEKSPDNCDAVGLVITLLQCNMMAQCNMMVQCDMMGTMYHDVYSRIVTE